MLKTITFSAAKAAGLKRYYTGEPCSRGHVAERAVSGYSCLECKRLKAASPEGREKRRDYKREHMSQWRAKNREKALATSRESYKKHAEKRRSEKIDAYYKNHEENKAKLRERYEKNREAHAEYQRIYRAANKEFIAILKRARKAMHRAAEGRYKPSDIMALFDRQLGVCVGCSTDISSSYHIDHITPLVKGGSNWPSNLQLLCPTCNLSKGAKTMDEWRSCPQRRSVTA